MTSRRITRGLRYPGGRRTHFGNSTVLRYLLCSGFSGSGVVEQRT